MAHPFIAPCSKDNFAVVQVKRLQVTGGATGGQVSVPKGRAESGARRPHHKIAKRAERVQRGDHVGSMQAEAASSDRVRRPALL
jgi:hypothetical protein